MASGASFEDSSIAAGVLMGAEGNGTMSARFHQSIPAIRLFFRVWIVVSVASFLALNVWDRADRERRTNASIENSIERILLAWQAGVDGHDFLDASQTADLGKLFILQDVILGGIVLSPTGNTLASFGQLPNLTWQNVYIDGNSSRYSAKEKIVDVSLSTIDTGATYDVILRIPGPGHVFSKLAADRTFPERIVRYAVTASVIAILASGLVLAFILGPHWRIQRAATRAATARTNVDSCRLKWQRKDTIGDTGKALDALIAHMHYLRESELAPLRHAFQKSGLPILKFNANGRFSEGNDAAALFFEKENSSQLKDLDFLFTTIAEHHQGSPLELAQLSGNGAYQGQAMVHTAKGNSKICFIDVTTMAPSEARKSAAIQVILADATTFFTRMVSKEQEARALRVINRKAKRHEILLQRQLDAFYTICKPTSDPADIADETSVFISVERLILEWYEENVDMGEAPSDLEHTALEAVSGNPEKVRNALRQAYNTVFSKSGELAPQIRINSKLVRGGMAEFCIEQVPVPDARSAESQSEMMSWTHNLGALKKALKEAGGQLVYFDTAALPVRIVLQLPAFRTAGNGARPVPAEEIDAVLRKTG
uniref:hypothetical protein n=1 Tax=Pararhizobium sp. IMCC3301 TaxID=3067904 RepID=UPI002741F06D|nr:hypothetical protein [Pararhizobium sp. IMCC3301]